jgi:hypothetical protein
MATWNFWSYKLRLKWYCVICRFMESHIDICELWELEIGKVRVDLLFHPISILL